MVAGASAASLVACTPYEGWRGGGFPAKLSTASLSSTCGKAENMSAASLKRKLRGFPTGSLSVRVVGN